VSMILPVTCGAVAAGIAVVEAMMDLAIRSRTWSNRREEPPQGNIHRGSEGVNSFWVLP
jgi:hypothetical protein